jgi:hypothetical protein
LNKNRKAITAVALIAMISMGVVIALNQTSDEDSFLMDLFASWGEIISPEYDEFALADQQLADNTTVVVLGTINNTKALNGKKYGFEVIWNDDFNQVELVVLLSFKLPQQINQTTLVNYYANITFYVTVSHNGTYDWAFRIPAIHGPQSDGVRSDVPWWRDGSATNTETFAVEISVNDYDYFIPYVNEANEVHAKFTVIVEGHVGDYTQLLIDFGKITIYQ